MEQNLADNIAILRNINNINIQLAKTDQITYAYLYHNITGTQIDFNEYKYLEDIYKDESREIVIQKGRQCGISEWLIDKSFYLTENKKLIGLYCFPTQGLLNEFSHARIDPVINQSEHLSIMVGEINNVSLKKIGNTYIYFRGMQDINQVSSVNADYINFDELDLVEQELIPVAERCVGGSKYKIVSKVSTPSWVNHGINLEYKDGDMREWFIKCEHCGKWQYLDFFKNVDLNKEIYVCKRCQKPINNLQRGEWVPRYKDREKHSYHISRLMSPRAPIKELIKNYNNKTFIKEFYNLDLGLPYVVNGKKLQKENIDALVTASDYQMYFNGSRCCMGVDIGKQIHFYITENINGKPRTVIVGTIDGQSVDDYKILERYMQIYNVVTCVIDAAPEPRFSKILHDLFPERVYLAYYPSMPKDVYYSKIKRDGINIVNINRTLSLDYTFDDFIMQNIDLPSDIQSVENFYSQMLALTKITTFDKRSGNENTQYINQGADHFAHARNYCRVAEKISGIYNSEMSYVMPSPKKDRQFYGGLKRVL